MSCTPSAKTSSAKIGLPFTDFLQTGAKVVDLVKVSSRYFYLQLKSPELAKRAQPGQFVMLSSRDELSDSMDPLLPRPLAILDADSQSGIFSLLFFIAGKGTGLLAQAEKDSEYQVIGPLGNGFVPLSDVDIHVGIAGGSGVAPLVFFFRHAFGEKQKGQEKHLILGFRSADQLPPDEILQAKETLLHKATDDGTAGFKGNAVQALRSMDLYKTGGKRVALYTAGPEIMMQSVVDAAAEKGLPCRVSLEERMACGVGVCRGCVVDAIGPHFKTGLHRRAVCLDGPVFDPSELTEWAAKSK